MFTSRVLTVIISKILLVLRKRSLFLSVLHELFISGEALARAHRVHVSFSAIHSVPFLAPVKKFFLGSRPPERIDIYYLEKQFVFL